MTRAFSSYASWKDKSFTAKEEVPAALKGFNSFHPIGPMRRPNDLAETVAFLLTDKLSWVTGVIMTSIVAQWLNAIDMLLDEQGQIPPLGREAYVWDRLYLIQSSISLSFEYGTNLQFGCVMPVIIRDIFFSTSRR